MILTAADQTDEGDVSGTTNFFSELEGDATPFAAAPRLIGADRTIQCPVCEKRTLSLRTGPGRLTRHRDMQVEVPHDFPLPECSSCGARPIDLNTARKLEPLLEAALERQRGR